MKTPFFTAPSASSPAICATLAAIVVTMLISLIDAGFSFDRRLPADVSYGVSMGKMDHGMNTGVR